MKSFQTQTRNKLLFTLLLSGIVYVTLAQDIQPYRAKEVEPYKAKEVEPNKTNEVKHNRAQIVIPGSDKNKENNPSVNSDMPYFFGLYQYWVPGTSYTTADYTNQQIVIHNSSGTGVLPGGISINKDKTYIWNSSWDEKIIKGTWRATGDQEYPIELVKAQEGKNWKVGKSRDKGTEIVIWDGNTWYNGKKLHK